MFNFFKKKQNSKQVIKKEPKGTPFNIEGHKADLQAVRIKIAAEVAAEENAEEEAAPAAPIADIQVEGAVTTIRGGKVVISIKEGKDIYLELPI